MFSGFFCFHRGPANTQPPSKRKLLKGFSKRWKYKAENTGNQTLHHERIDVFGLGFSFFLSGTALQTLLKCALRGSALSSFCKRVANRSRIEAIPTLRFAPLPPDPIFTPRSKYPEQDRRAIPTLRFGPLLPDPVFTAKSEHPRQNRRVGILKKEW